MQSGGLFRAMIKKFTSSSCRLHFQPDHPKQFSKSHSNVSPDPSPRESKWRICCDKGSHSGGFLQ
jgi:hypothetical protein